MALAFQLLASDHLRELESERPVKGVSIPAAHLRRWLTSGKQGRPWQLGVSLPEGDVTITHAGPLEQRTSDVGRRSGLAESWWRSIQSRRSCCGAVRRILSGSSRAPRRSRALPRTLQRLATAPSASRPLHACFLFPEMPFVLCVSVAAGSPTHVSFILVCVSPLKPQF